MTTVTTSAPGKLFLLGEYAVLEGAPALLAAVDARVAVTVGDATDGCWHLAVPGLATPRLATPRLAIERLTLGPNGVIPDDTDDRTTEALRVFDAVRSCVADVGVLPDALDVTIDSTAFSLGGRKLGLGSSAAVAVALTSALGIAHGLGLDSSALFALAATAHRHAQRGAGSGGDVAASVYGGLLSYTTGTTPESLGWPEGLVALAVVTGDGASTTDLMSRVGAYARRDPSAYRTDIRRLAELAGQARDTLGSPADFLALASSYFDALVELDDHAHAGIVTQRHRELRAVAASAGGVFKTSGAGGGDLGLAFSLSGAPRDDLTAALAAAGAQVLPLDFCADGVRSETTP